MSYPWSLSAAVLAVAAAVPASAQDAGGSSGADLAKQLSNPISSLISVPFQLNYNQGYSGGDGEQWSLNIQPVIPFSLNADWNVISRTIFPIVSQTDVIPGDDSQLGFGNTTQSFFFSPKEPTRNGIVWGVGPVIVLPTASHDIGQPQWGAGITGVVLRQSKGWTIGALANQVWSISGDSEYGEKSSAFLQPFVSYTTPSAMSFTLNTESTYDWETEEWSVPINATIGQVVKIDKHPVQLSAGVRYYAESAENGPDGWGLRLQATLLFPK